MLERRRVSRVERHPKDEDVSQCRETKIRITEKNAISLTLVMQPYRLDLTLDIEKSGYGDRQNYLSPIEGVP